jgi:uncharacterized protein
MPPSFPDALRVERLQVSIPGLPLRLRGLRLAQWSDLHYDGVKLSDALLARAIATTNALQPDLICLTGDFITWSPDPIHSLAAKLTHLRAPLGRVAVLGNHDRHQAQAQSIITTALTDHGTQVLWNQVVYPAGEGLAIVGLADFWSKAFNPAPVFAPLAPNLPRVVLSHNPDSAERLQPWRVDLQLSGHSHGGQINLPGLGSVAQALVALDPKIPHWLTPLKTATSILKGTMRHWEWSQGLHQVGQNRLYVNRGLGTYPPGRLFCAPEITLITLVS